MLDRETLVAAIAEEFAKVLHRWLSKHEYVEMKRLNDTDPAYAAGACASHNYCDANMAMDEAFTAIMGRSVNADLAGDVALFNSAWALARKLYIGGQT